MRLFALGVVVGVVLVVGAVFVGMRTGRIR